MSLKQILASTFLLASFSQVRCDYSYDSGSGYGSGWGSDNDGSSNEGDQSTAYTADGSGGYGGVGSYSNGWGQSTETPESLVQTVSVVATETMMMIITVTESQCTINAADATYASTYTTPTSSPSPMYSQAGTVMVQEVHVSDNNGTLAYSPESIVAEPGTMVEFLFYPKNHTVTQSSFAVPCVPIGISTPNATTPEAPGIKSGFVPVAANATDFISGIRSRFSFMVNDTKPIWLYCGQLGHCQKGMAMVINQNMSDTVHTLDNYKIAAAQVPLPGNGSMSSPYGALPGASSAGPSTYTSTFTAAFPPPAVPSSAPLATQQPQAAATTSAAAVASPTTSGPSVSTFTGAAVRVEAAGVMAGVFALGAVALL